MTRQTMTIMTHYRMRPCITMIPMQQSRIEAKGCPCNPLYRKRLAKRFKGVNSSAAEQVFSWFRNYARLLNECSPMRHSFKVLYFVKLHNLAVERKQSNYLNRHVRNGSKAKRPYSCSKTSGPKKRPASAMSA